MFLTSLVVLQLIFDVAVATLLIALLVRRRPPADTTPPAWHRESIALVQDLVAATEPMLDALESRRPEFAAQSAPGGTPRDRHRRALALLRAGVHPDDVARRDHILPGELRLLRTVAAGDAAVTPGA